jgi:hypothetical protein
MQEPKTGKSSSKLSTPHHAFLQKAEYLRVKPHKPKKNQIYEGLVNMMKSVIVRLNNLDMVYNPVSQVNKIWVRKDEIIHPLRGSGLT